MDQVVHRVASVLPDIDSFLGPIVKATGSRLLKGNAEDYLLSVLIAIAFPLMRLVLDKTVYDWFGRKCLRFPAYKKSDDPPSPEAFATLHKFKESAYKCGVQIFFSLMLILVAVPKPWFTNTWLYWSDCNRLPCDAEPTLGERLIYLIELAFYAQAIPMLFVWETKRKDIMQYFSHHVATVILIGYSYYLNITRVGVMVLVCHEANDIFLEAAKMARYANSEFFATFFFVVFMLSWFATRIYAFGFIVIRSTLVESHKRAAQVGVNIEPHTSILNGFLIFLYVLHIYWSYLIVRIAVRQLTKGELDDIREEEDEEQEVKPTALNPSRVKNVGQMHGSM